MSAAGQFPASSGGRNVSGNALLAGFLSRHGLDAVDVADYDPEHRSCLEHGRYRVAVRDPESGVLLAYPRQDCPQCRGERRMAEHLTDAPKRYRKA
ncbi:hypothetical protein JKG47_22750, partial [Acidithiobacillus sp. MC6.1]|nr:hypothetical protein [Acidithiobacillus sp. MC6.1]